MTADVFRPRFANPSYRIFVLIVLTKKKLLGILTIFVDLNSTPVSATVRGFLLQVMLMLLNTKL